MLSVSAVQTRPHTHQSRCEIVERVILAMRSRTAEHMSLQDMADLACLSPFHFNRIFHQTTGITPTQFLYAIRLEKAKRLLLTSSLTVTEICFEVGYNSLGTFIYRFTQFVGVSPTHFRSLASNMSVSDFRKLVTADHQLQGKGSATASGVHGRIYCPSSFTGVIFVGLFDMRIPQKRPVAGTVLMQVDHYDFGICPNGRYYVMAAGLPFSLDPMTYWLPDPSTLLVGIGNDLLLVQDNQKVRSINVTLRPTNIFDPPILISLPALLANDSNALHGES
ncbi:MAG TPA: AraC family transcriptional regulator [Pyrinomonadaceae bacterium]